jgi:hypothetical protein
LPPPPQCYSLPVVALNQVASSGEEVEEEEEEEEEKPWQ